MSNHKILLNFTHADVLETVASVLPGFKVVEQGSLLSVEQSRHTSKNFISYSNPTDVYLINVQAFDRDEMFAPFLKALEYTTGGVIWFIGLELSGYPATIRSRCRVETFISASVGRVRRFLKTSGEQHEMADMLHLVHYSLGSASEMLKRRDEFADFLITLDSSRMLELVHPAITNFDVHHYNLLLEWLHSSDIFTERELALCSFLRKERFTKRVEQMSILKESLMCEATFLSAFLCKALEA